MISSYHEAITFLYDNLPMFQRIGAAAIKKDLTNTLRLCEYLNHPERTFKTIHVAGTNGKGSTSHMLASVLQAAGYRTGLYTSPHLREFTERIRVDGVEVPQSWVVDFVNRIRPAIEEIKPSFFEITVAMAFDYFSHEKVDIAVIETGLGGRLDSTNVITPLLSVITNISWDHKDVLGDTLELIAQEKGGIIKRGIPAVISERQPAVEDVFLKKAESEGAELHFASDEFIAVENETPGHMTIMKNGNPVLDLTDFPLGGGYQRHNLAGVFKAVEILRRQFRINDEHVESGLKNVVSNTGLKGRWQVIQHRPTVVCDTGHNAGGISEVVRQIGREKFDRLFMIIGMVKDKDIRTVLSLLPANAAYFFCQARIPRAMDAQLLQREAAQFGLRGEAVPDVNTALKNALEKASDNDLIFVGGSTYVVAELERL